MADSTRVDMDASLAHVQRGDLRDPEVSDKPLIGEHDKEADRKATEKYLRRKHETSPIGLEPPELLEEKLKPADPYENVRVLIQAKPKLWSEVPQDVKGYPIEGVDLIDALSSLNSISGQPSDVMVDDIPTFEDHPVFELRVMPKFETKDSGQREDFPTGSRRDTRTGKGRYDLLPPYAIQRLAQVYERGAGKYGDKNWLLGQPLSRFLDSALRHTFQVLEGKTDEDHAGQAAWNLLAFIEIQQRVKAGLLPADLDDM